ncbi:hypothetical protein, partial [Imhoffiella purpurea]|uniref:hypothetical protein n=1 Tax=Imhoffiella purpurea TaxID=1249627 RepID=UPI0005C132DB
MRDASRRPPVGPESRVGRTQLTAALTGLGLIHPLPVLVLVGGAANLEPHVEGPLRLAFDALVPVIDRIGAALVDGGTAFGVMRLIGDSRRRLGGRFPLIGVAAVGTVDGGSLPAGVPVQEVDPAVRPEHWVDGARLDPDHSHFLLVPGERWGDESPWIDAAAAALAGGRPILTLVAAGGRITAPDV